MVLFRDVAERRVLRGALCRYTHTQRHTHLVNGARALVLMALSWHTKNGILFCTMSGVTFTLVNTLAIAQVCPRERLTLLHNSIPWLVVPLWMPLHWAVTAQWAMDLYCISKLWVSRRDDVKIAKDGDASKV